jgi:predicted hydrocarbon binding protein
VVGVERSGELNAKITVGRGPGEPLVCACSAGILEQVANLAGASAAAVDETACESTGADACTFAIRWQPRR